MSTCPKLDTCQRILSLFDRDWAGDWQIDGAALETCANCTDRERAEVLWRRERYLGYEIVQLEDTPAGLKVITWDGTEWVRRLVLERKV